MKIQNKFPETMCQAKLSCRIILLLRILIVLCFTNILLCSFNASIWADEAFTLGMIENNMSDVIRLTALDVHPPLYYMMLKIVEDLFSIISTSFSFKVVIAKLFSVLAFALTGTICWVKFRHINTRGFRELLLLCLFSTSGILTYSVEIRMYGWALFFVTGTYLYAKDIMDGDSSFKTWGFFILYSLCSAYTHNYALISMAAIWLYLLIWLFLYHYSDLKKWFVGGLITGICYLPWLLVLINQTSRISENYWISDITLSTVADYINYAFPSIFIIIPVIILFFFLHERNSKNNFYLLTGALVPMTTIAIGIAVSLIMRPVFVKRYMIPGLFCLWITILLCWCKMRKRQKLIVAGIIVCGCIMFGCEFFIDEYSLHQQAEESLALIDSMEEDSVICVEGNYGHVCCTVAAYTDKTVYLISDEKYTMSELGQHIYTNLRTEDCKFVANAVNNGQVIYFIAAKKNSAISSWNDKAEIVSLGEFTFENKRQVYRITP